VKDKQSTSCPNVHRPVGRSSCIDYRRWPSSSSLHCVQSGRRDHWEKTQIPEKQSEVLVYWRWSKSIKPWKGQGNLVRTRRSFGRTELLRKYNSSLGYFLKNGSQPSWISSRRMWYNQQHVFSVLAQMKLLLTSASNVLCCCIGARWGSNQTSAQCKNYTICVDQIRFQPNISRFFTYCASWGYGTTATMSSSGTKLPLQPG
jgi:hypothetical protein